MGASKLEQYNKETKLVAEYNKAFSHAARLTILESLKEQPGLRPTDLEKLIELSHNAASEHIRHLRNTGLVEFKYVTHHNQVFLNTEGIKTTIEFLQRLLD